MGRAKLCWPLMRTKTSALPEERLTLPLRFTMRQPGASVVGRLGIQCAASSWTTSCHNRQEPATMPCGLK
ncbi:MAG: hypothetical protein CVU65_12675 [Deltaproteobacteria bacterium HGW-Deltaproteobacteria-22]|nr:MAG: hypothetical protein CVU65_12675 [Deltaproteobacteria bacterium HGW-Deltaproteobacteria-22]